jgi:hypothetical protein
MRVSSNRVVFFAEAIKLNLMYSGKEDQRTHQKYSNYLQHAPPPHLPDLLSSTPRQIPHRQCQLAATALGRDE